MNITEDGLKMFENMLVQMQEEDLSNSANIQVMKAMHGGLLDAGMSRSYADQLVAASTVDITDVLLDENQLTRLLNTSRGIAFEFCTLFREAGFNDEAIALMGSQLSIKLTG